jgi:hypothetical protein
MLSPKKWILFITQSGSRGEDILSHICMAEEEGFELFSPTENT